MADVLIAGGGIAGLAAAIALRRIGLGVHVYEAAPRLEPVGAGIWLPPNAMEVMRRLELADEVRGAGIPLDRLEVYSRGRVLQSMDGDEAERRWRHRTVSIARAKLHAILRAALADDELSLGRRCDGFEVQEGGITARFADGSVRSGALLVGADGIHSAVRAQLFPNASLRYSGQTCYRGVADHRPPAATLRNSREVWGGDHRFGYSAIAECRVYWFAPVTAPPGTALETNDLTDTLLARYAGFPDPVTTLIRRTAPESILQTDLYDLRPLAAWHRGRVVLIGDAAHATTPNLGQGGAQAIEDGLSLAVHIEAHGLTPAALAAFQRCRGSRTNGIVRESRLFGRIAHVKSPGAQAMRDGLIRMTASLARGRKLDELFSPVVGGGPTR